MTTIQLSRPYDVFGKPVTEVTLAEPTGAQVFRLGGAPYMMIYPVNAMPFQEPLWDRISGYLDLCILDGTGKANQAFAAALKAQLVWADLDALRDALIDFFTLTPSTAAAGRA